VQYCLFYNDRPKRLSDDPYEQRNPRQFGGNYIGGMDVMNAEGWSVSDNVFLAIHGLTGEARGAIFFWNQSSNCVIERNIIVDCDSGIYLGNGMRQPDAKVHCTGFVVRNNFVTRCPEGAITAIYTRDCKIVHNTVHDPTNKLGRSIRIVHDGDGLLIANNLCSGPNINVSADAGRVEVRDNLQRVVTDAFVDPAKGNLHLIREAAERIGRGAALPDVPNDVDRRPRGPKPMIGAHELGTPGGRE
jgi:parallel beta-helix repeat protein